MPNQKTSNEYESFRAGLSKVLKADPRLVMAAMEQEKSERAEDRKTRGKGVQGGKTKGLGRK